MVVNVKLGCTSVFEDVLSIFPGVFKSIFSYFSVHLRVFRSLELALGALQAGDRKIEHEFHINCGNDDPTDGSKLIILGNAYHAHYGSGSPWVINEDLTISPSDRQTELVLAWGQGERLRVALWRALMRLIPP